MTSLEFQGFVGLNNKQSEFIRSVLEKRGFKNNIVTFEPATKVGDNYVADVQRITVKVEDGNDFKMIVKIAPNVALHSTTEKAVLFKNETAMYEQVLPKFTSLQVAADVPEEERLRFPECYGCLTEEFNELILLEDLKASDYVMLNRLAYLDNDTVKLILKNFAVLHSISFALKKQEPGVYEIMKGKLTDIWGQAGSEKGAAFFLQVEKSVLKVLDDDRYKKPIEGMSTRTVEVMKKMQKYEIHSKHLIIQQGDAWTNNLMFKLQDNKPTECVMIDYQLSKESNPVCDILYMVFTCTNHATRSKHYYEWIDYYHDQLDKALHHFGMKANLVYSRDQLDTDLKGYSKIYFGFVLFLYILLSRKPEETADLEDALQDETQLEATMDIKALSNDTVSLFKDKIKGLIDSYREFGYIA